MAQGKKKSTGSSPRPEVAKAKVYRILESVKYDGQYLQPGDRSDFATLSPEQIQHLINGGWISGR